MCISSRSLRVFENAFAKLANLQMHDFTSDDMRLYIEKRLLNIVPADDADGLTHHELHALINNIQESADGVFLWVVLVVNRVRESLQDGDEIEDVLRMVTSLPRDVEELFMSLLRAIKTAHLKEASRYLQLALHATDYLDLCVFQYSTLR